LPGYEGKAFAKAAFFNFEIKPTWNDFLLAFGLAVFIQFTMSVLLNLRYGQGAFCRILCPYATMMVPLMNISPVQKKITRVRGSMEHILKLLTSLQATDQSMPTVKLYEGVDGFKKMLEETLSARGEILVFSYVPLFSELVGVKHLDDYFRRRSARGIHTRLLFPPCDYAEKVALHSREYKIQVRTLPPQYVWQSGIFSWNDSLALMSYTERHLTCTIIENREIAYFFRMVMFEMCWKQGHRLETKSNGKDVII
jgi:hypothetical protein